MSWFETVTGTSNSERQAWRDNFNGGYAVGAGASFYNAHLPGAGGGGSLGISKSGSDGQVKGSGNAVPTPTGTTVKNVQPTNTGRGGGPTIEKDWSPTRYAPNQAGGPVTTGNPGPGQQAGTGPGTGGGWGGGPVKLKPKDNPEFTQIVMGGHNIVHDAGWSDGGDMEDRWGEWGGGIGGLGVMAADLWSTGRVVMRDKVKEADSWLSQTFNSGTTFSNKPADFSNMTSPGWDFGADMRWLNEDLAGSVGGGF